MTSDEARRTTVTETVVVPEIHCEHCKSSIEGALARLDGVRSAEVDVSARTVWVRYDASRVGRDGVLDAIEDQGYEVSR